MRFLARRIENLDAADVVDRIDRSLAAYPSELSTSMGWWRHFTLLRFSARIVQRIFNKLAQSMPERPDNVASVAQADEPNRRGGWKGDNVARQSIIAGNGTHAS